MSPLIIQPVKFGPEFKQTSYRRKTDEETVGDVEEDANSEFKGDAEEKVPGHAGDDTEDPMSNFHVG